MYILQKYDADCTITHVDRWSILKMTCLNTDSRRWDDCNHLYQSFLPASMLYISINMLLLCFLCCCMYLPACMHATVCRVVIVDSSWPSVRLIRQPIRSRIESHSHSHSTHVSESSICVCACVESDGRCEVDVWAWRMVDLDAARSSRFAAADDIDTTTSMHI